MFISNGFYQTQNCSAPYLSCHPSLSSPASASTRASYIPAASSSLRNLVFRLPLMSANCNRWFKYVKGLTLVSYQYIYCTGYICMYEGLGWTGVPDLLLMWFASAAHHQQLGSADMNRTCFGDRDFVTCLWRSVDPFLGRETGINHKVIL